MRRAAAKDAQRAADVWLESRRFAYPAVLACIHSDSSVRLSFREEFLPSSDVWVAEQGTPVVEVVFLADGWIDQLYVTPAQQGPGPGSRLVRLAKRRSPRGPAPLDVRKQSPGPEFLPAPRVRRNSAH